MANPEFKERFLEIVLYGVEKALWDALGKSSFAFTSKIGEEICKEMRVSACEEGSFASVEEALQVGSQALHKLGIVDGIKVLSEDSHIVFQVKDCSLLDVEEKLIENGVKPFICPIMNSAVYMLRKKLGLRARIAGIDVDFDGRTCRITFEKL